ncbi:acetyl-CoA synthetase [Irineochytrium annulatum]|nr:acetyl-CoA synthetase [Irineochytrium annulatum]
MAPGAGGRQETYKALTGSINDDGLNRYEVDLLETADWVKRMLLVMRDQHTVPELTEEQLAAREEAGKKPHPALIFTYPRIYTYDFTMDNAKHGDEGMCLLVHVSSLLKNESAAVRHKFLLLAGDRYNPYEDVVKLSRPPDDKVRDSLTWRSHAAERLYLVRLLNRILKEAKHEPAKFKDLKVDLRHVTPRKSHLAFPEEWKRAGPPPGTPNQKAKAAADAIAPETTFAAESSMLPSNVVLTLNNTAVEVDQLEGVNLIHDSLDPSSSSSSSSAAAARAVTLSVSSEYISWATPDDAKPAAATPSKWFGWLFGLFRARAVRTASTVPLNFVIAATVSSTVPLATLASAVASDPPDEAPDASKLLTLHILDHGVVPFMPTNPPPSKRPKYRVVAFKFEKQAEMRVCLDLLGARGVAVPKGKGDVETKKPVLFVLNPFGGVKESVKIYRTIVEPMMKLANLPFQLLETTHKLHAEEHCRAINAANYSAVVAISGDGVLHEVINGLMTRPDWDLARQLPVGVIGAGSSNAMNRNLDCMYPEYGALCVVKGLSRPLDLLSITHHKTRTVHYTHLNVAWAYIADLDIESDRYRWLGREKTTLCAIIRMIWLRRYRAHLHILPADHPAATPTTSDTTNLGPPRSYYASDPKTWPISVNPSKDPLTYLMLNNLPWIATDFRAAHAPRLGNGVMEVSYAERLSRSALLRCLLSGQAFDRDNKLGVKFVNAKAVHLVPLGWSYAMGEFDGGDLEAAEGTKGDGGVVDVSGEPFEMGPVTVEVHERSRPQTTMNEEIIADDVPIHQPPARLLAGGVCPAPHVASMDQYRRMHTDSVKDPGAFFAKCELTGTIAQSSFKAGNMTWFEDGRLNVSANCVDRHARAHPDRVAIIWEADEPGQATKITYAQLLADVCRFANVLISQGVRKGDTVAIYMPMVPEAAVAMLACARLGAVHSVVFAGFSADALRDRIQDAGCRIVVTADQGKRGGKAIQLKRIADEAIRQCPSVKADQRPYCPAEPMSAEDALFMLYTSGSTGKPKGVVHTTAGYLLGVTLTTKYVFDLHPSAGDVHACMADVGWITGHSYIVYGPLSNGATTLMFESIPTYPTPARYWQVVDEHKVTQLYTAPTAIRALRRMGDEHVKPYKLDTLRVLGSVGEPINPEAWNWYNEVVGRKRCAIVDTYWQTETGSIIVTPLPGATPTKPGAATFPFFGIDLAVLDPTSGKELTGPNVTGVLAVRSSFPSVTRTVYNNHRRYMDTYLNPYKGFYFTGDGVTRDKDGYYWIRGRVDDVINVSGHRLSTSEIESALVLHPACAEAAAVGVNDDVTGQAVICFCTLKTAEADEATLAAALRGSIRTHIGPFATPKAIVITPDLPKTRSGKIMRRILRKVAAGDVRLADLADPEAVKAKLGDLSTLAEETVIKALVERVDKAGL